MPASPNALEHYLARHDDHAWHRTAGLLDAETHEVDRTAVRIWLSFFPIALKRLLDDSHDRAELEQRLLLRGQYRLADQADTSHAFFYGHRFWPDVKRAIVEHADRTTGRFAGPLAGIVRDIAHDLAGRMSLDRTLLTGIVVAGLNTLEQLGLDNLRRTPGAVAIDPAVSGRTPDDVLRHRARDDSQGLFGFLRGEHKVWTVTFDERDPASRFRLVNSQAITTAAAADPRDWRDRDPRCTEGPIPIQCRSASCGTCWVGVLGGADKLLPVEPRERRKLREFGYIDTEAPHPLIRLACQARATGAVSIVIPSWTGVIGAALATDASGEPEAATAGAR
jgi:ferredoxin